MKVSMKMIVTRIDQLDDHATTEKVARHVDTVIQEISCRLARHDATTECFEVKVTKDK